MRKLFAFLSILLAAAGLLGCNFAYAFIATPTPEVLSTPGVTPAKKQQRVPKLTGNWHIRMAQTGGIAGVSRTLEIYNGGGMTITDERPHKQVTSQLSPDQLSQLTEIVASTVYRPNKEPMGCADCFIFDLQIDNGKEHFQVQIDQVNLPNSGLESLIGFLGQLLNSTQL